MTVHRIANYMTQAQRHDAFMRLHPIVSVPQLDLLRRQEKVFRREDTLPCDVGPRENNLRADGTPIVPCRLPTRGDLA